MVRLSSGYVYLVFIVVLASCAPRLVWNKPGLTDSHLAQDKYQCMKETGFAEPNAFTKLGLVFSSTAAGMQGGPNPHAARAQAIGQRRQFFAACMESKGYKLESDPQKPEVGQRLPHNRPSQSSAPPKAEADKPEGNSGKTSYQNWDEYFNRPREK